MINFKQQSHTQNIDQKDKQAFAQNMTTASLDNKENKQYTQQQHPNLTQEREQENKDVQKNYDQDELIYYDLFCECQDNVINECLEPLEYSNLQKLLPIGKLTKYNQALLQNIAKQVYQQLQLRLKKKFSMLQDKYKVKNQLADVQRIKQEQQIIQQLGYQDNIVDQDENQVFIEILLKNMKLLSNEVLNEERESVQHNQQKINILQPKTENNTKTNDHQKNSMKQL